MSIKYKIGDLLEAPEMAIAHGANCQGLMGAGVAKLIRAKYPTVYSAYLAACMDGSFRVGTAQPVLVDPAIYGSQAVVYNLGTQHFPGADATAWGVFLSFANMAEHAVRNGINTVATCRVGSGIGGLNFDRDVVPGIEEALARSNHPGLDIVVYDLFPVEGTTYDLPVGA